MPQVPVQTAQTVFSGSDGGMSKAAPYQDIQTNPNAFGANVGQAMGNVGQGMDQAAQNFGQIAQIQAESTKNAATTSWLSHMNDILNGNPQNGMVGYRTLNGKAAVDAYSQYQQNIMDSYQKARDSLSPLAQRMFDQTGLWALRSTLSQLSGHYAQQQHAYDYQEARGAVTIAQQTALNGADSPDTWNSGLAAVQDSSLNASKVMGLDGDAAEEQRRADIGQMYTARLKQISQRDPVQAEKFYQDNVAAFPIQQRFELGQMVKSMANTQYAANDGAAALNAATGQWNTLPSQKVPQDFNADFVKPYDDKQISGIARQVTKPSEYDPIINKVAAQYHLNPWELKLHIAAESGFDPDAKSPQGAVGLAQLMPETAKGLGVDPKDPAQAIDGMARLMVKAQAQAGDDPAAVDRFYYGGSTTAHGPNTDQYVANLAAVRASLHGGTLVPAPMTSAQYEGIEGDVIRQADVVAEQRRPGDAGYRLQVEAEAQKQWARNLQVMRGQEYARFSGVLDAAVKGGFQSAAEMPAPLQQTYAQLTPQNLESINAQFQRNIKAASGEFTPSDPKLYNSLQARINLAMGDPNKLTDPSQITPYIAHGLNYTDFGRLITQMKDVNSPEANPFLRQVNGVQTTARKMLLSQTSAMAHPELAEEAAYRFNIDLQNRITTYRQAGKDPQALFMPSSPDYVLAPSRVAAFMPTQSEIAAQAANKTQATNKTQSAAAVYPTATNSKTGERLIFKGGSWQAMR